MGKSAIAAWLSLTRPEVVGVHFCTQQNSRSLNPYEFVAVSALRAKQLLAGCTPRLEGDHSPATMAQMEVAAGRITRADATEPTQLPQCGWQL